MKRVVIIGDATHNTLSAVRSLGEAGIPLILILVGREDPCFVRYSKYLQQGNLFTVEELSECEELLSSLAAVGDMPILMTTYDAAAEWVDSREPALSRQFVTPCRGKQLGDLFNKESQCKLAEECGLDVPKSIVYQRGKALPTDWLQFPMITKPLVSSAGSKGDIHICHDLAELERALEHQSDCQKFILQQFIDKEYELNCICVSTDDGVVMGGGIRKYRHWPRLVGAATYGVFDRMDSYNVNMEGVKRFIEASNYHGPFSIELLHTRDGKNYFMEVNFRNDGLAYASTCAGVNLHALYADGSRQIDWGKFHKTYMMNYSIDLLYVKEGELSWWQWLRDLLRTRCFINVCLSDLRPTIEYYRAKLHLRH